MDDVDNFLVEELIEISRAVVKINDSRKDYTYEPPDCRVKLLKDSTNTKNEVDTIYVRPCELLDPSQPCDIRLHYFKKAHLPLPFLCLEKIKNPIIMVKEDK